MQTHDRSSSNFQNTIRTPHPGLMEVEGDMFISTPKVRVVQTTLLPRCSYPFKEDSMQGRTDRINRMAVAFRSLSTSNLIKVMDGQAIMPTNTCDAEFGDHSCRRELFEAAKSVWYSRVHEKDSVVVGPWGKRVLSSCLTTPLLREIDWDVPVQEVEAINYYLSMIETHFTVNPEGEDMVVRGPAETIYLTYHFDPDFVIRKIAERFCTKFLDNHENAIAVTWPQPAFPRWLAKVPEHESAEPIRGVFVTETGIVDFNERADIVGQLLLVAKAVYVWTPREKEILEEVYPGIQVGGLLRADPEGTRVLAFKENDCYYAAVVKQESMSHVNVISPLQNWGFGPMRYMALIFQATYRSYQLTATESVQMAIHYMCHGALVLFTDGKASYDVKRGTVAQMRVNGDVLYLNSDPAIKVPAFPSTGISNSLILDLSHLFSLEKSMEMKFRQFQVWFNDQKIPYEGMEILPHTTEVIMPVALPLRVRFLGPPQPKVREPPIRVPEDDRPKTKIQVYLSNPTNVLQVFLYYWRKTMGGFTTTLSDLSEEERIQAWRLLCANLREIPQIMTSKLDEDPMHTFMMHLAMNLSLTGGRDPPLINSEVRRLLEVRKAVCQPYCTVKRDGINWVEFLGVSFGDDQQSSQSIKLTDDQLRFLKMTAGPARVAILNDPRGWLAKWNDMLFPPSPSYTPYMSEEEGKFTPLQDLD